MPSMRAMYLGLSLSSLPRLSGAQEKIVIRHVRANMKNKLMLNVIVEQSFAFLVQRKPICQSAVINCSSG